MAHLCESEIRRATLDDELNVLLEIYLLLQVMDGNVRRNGDARKVPFAFDVAPQLGHWVAKVGACGEG
jgi:hypothetical protein